MDSAAFPYLAAEHFSQRWDELCSRFLPLVQLDSIWRYSRAADPGAPEQGWKLHISATLLNACAILERVGSLLQSRNVRFKAPISLEEVKKLNSGLYYEYSQVGKLITVYPDSTEEASELGQRLYELTRDFDAPPVPFDRRFRSDGCIYYRYGSFSSLFIEDADGKKLPAIRTPAGELVPDIRSATAYPEWISDPLAPDAEDDCNVNNPLQTTYRAFRALSQRGKGGVYQAFDLSVSPPRLCILKEGRLNGEQSWDGRDGVRRVQNEEKILKLLKEAGIDVPDLYASFVVQGNYYVVTEFIEGESLQSCLQRLRRRLPVDRIVRLAAHISLLVSQIHAAGWTWRDCKPSNLLITTNGKLRPVDFEGACPIDKPDPLPWGTQGFTPPQWRPYVESRVYEDLYGLGATLYFLLAGRPPEETAPPVNRLRRSVPTTMCHLVRDLLSADPARQPTAITTAGILCDLLTSERRLARTDLNFDGCRSVKKNRAEFAEPLLKQCFASKVGKPFLETVSTGSGSDLVNDGSQESLGITHADH